MAGLSADQRNYHYLSEAERTGIHKPILAALYAAHHRPTLNDGEVGLGIAPANRIPLDQVNTFPEQAQFAANTIRSITDKLTAQGWKGNDFWDEDQGRYTDRFVQMIAKGYTPPASDLAAARLEPSDFQKLLKAYLDDLTLDYKADGLPQNLSFLDSSLLRFIERTPRYYIGLSYQRDALLEAVRIWRKLNTRRAAIASLLRVSETDPSLVKLDDDTLDKPLMQFIQQISPFYAGYPHQREALLRFVQLWRQLDSRGETIGSLEEDTSPETNIRIIDPALIMFVQRVPQSFQGKGDQRNALTEAFRLWRGLDSRTTALKELGVDAQILTASNPNRSALINAATQLDRALLDFVKRTPANFNETEFEREALIRLVQLWRSIDGREKTVQSLLDDVRRMERARRDSPDAPPKPEPLPLPPRPARWTPNNLQMHTSIILNGNFTWAEATHGGSRIPPNQETVDAIVRIAELAQQARDRIGRPFRVTSWYRPSDINRQVGGVSLSRHIVGDAIDFYCDGLSGDQIYRALDPWWTGGLGRYTKYPELCHIDARGYRARWTH
ncbi:MAG: peptidase M15A [Cyanobacteria bacterium CRU_2_1]|nr:peptidase M15A [Cyanobacteria bacterium RU_5_0]NJR58345.1 peptidase M15A [Cyanobacteria bacterium CRU_2_1]